MDSRQLYIWSYVLSASAITYYTMRHCHNLPYPSRFIYAGLLFGMLDIFAGFQAELAGVFAIGFVIATFIRKGFIGDCQYPTTAQTASFQPGQNIYGQQPQPPTYAQFIPPNAGQAV